MQSKVAPIWFYVYALPALPLLLSLIDMREDRGQETKLVKPTFIAALLSFLWLYSVCFTQVWISASWSTLREIILVGNFFGILVIGALCFFAKPRFQIWTAVACLIIAIFWAITIAANSVV